MRTKIAALATMIDHLHRLEQRPVPAVTAEQLRDQIITYAKNCLPSGSGIDKGTVVDYDKSTAYKVVLTVDFHHMNADGFYTGWSTYTIVVRPAFDGLLLSVKGRDRNGIKEYLHQVYNDDLLNLDPWLTD